MTRVAPRTVNGVSYAMRTKYVSLSARQAQYLVKIKCHFSWQVQYLVTFKCYFSW